ncbi:MAG: hypothetical protein HY321_17090 [Armatimonadetes bacterium]|nr:hypothetical protein [Armatimonadota bacterium]
MASRLFGDLVKAVVDVRKRTMVVDAELHADQEAYLLEEGSDQDDLWGINLHPDQPEEDWIEFDSMINVRPRQGNPSRGVLDEEVRREIASVVNGLVTR